MGTNKAYVAVLDYSDGCIRMYEVTLNKGWQDDDVEQWLTRNTGYKDSHCYYMVSREPIKVIQEVVL